jgi:hypothetical protein
MEYTVSATNTWEKKTLRFTHDATGAWSYDNTIGLTVVWTIAAGSTFQTTANTWANGNFLATVNQANGVDSIANNFQLTDICLQEDNDGQTRVPDFQLAGRDVFDELRLCQRYYEVLSASIAGTWSSAITGRCGWFYKCTKRISPIITLIGSSGTVYSSSADFYIITITNAQPIIGAGSTADAEL